MAKGECVALTLLDLSATFDIINYCGIDYHFDLVILALYLDDSPLTFPF